MTKKRYLKVIKITAHVLNKGTIKVHPDEVHAMLQQHASIKKVRVPDAVHGQVLCACVTTARPTGADIELCGKQFTVTYQGYSPMTKHLIIMQELTMCNKGKVLHTCLQTFAST